MGGSLALIKEGEMLAVGMRDRSIALLDNESGDEVAMLRGHSEKIQSMAELNKCERLVSGSDDALYDFGT